MIQEKQEIRKIKALEKREGYKGYHRLHSRHEKHLKTYGFVQSRSLPVINKFSSPRSNEPRGPPACFSRVIYGSAAAVGESLTFVCAAQLC